MATEAELIQDLRAMLSDDDPEKNILNLKKEAYSDAKLRFFLKQALRDVNAGSPKTNYTLENMPEPDLLITGAMIFSFMAEGVLQLRNQLDYNDSGLSIGLFNKTGGYQSWAGFLLQSYLTSKAAFKRSILANSPGAGFYGIQSQFSTDWWY